MTTQSAIIICIDENQANMFGHGEIIYMDDSWVRSTGSLRHTTTGFGSTLKVIHQRKTWFFNNTETSPEKCDKE